MDVNLRLLQLFANKKIIKQKDIQAISQQCQALNVLPQAYLTEHGYCSEVEALPVMGEFYKLPHTQVGLLDIDKELLQKFSYSLMRRHKFLPVCIINDVLTVAVANPYDMHARSAIAAQFSLNCSFVLVPPSQIELYIDSITASISTAQALGDLQSVADSKSEQVKTVEREDDVLNNPSVRLVDSVIKEAIPLKASDIHVEPFEHTVKVRYRIDGDLIERAEFPIESYPSICARLKIISGINIAERRIPQDGRISVTVNGAEYDLRVSTLPTVYGEKFAIRILDKSSFKFTREELGFTDEENATVDKILSHSYGIVLLTGPTGCGKSTTLYSFINELNSYKRNIITVEDPVEYTVPGVNQVQVNPKANLTFANVLRSILRQDPDVIMVGEIRDEDTAEVAVRAAITGHLVFSTLHTNDSVGAVMRLQDMGISDYLVADAVIGVIAQRLVKKLCPECKRRSKTTAAEMAVLNISQPKTVYRANGCSYCSNTGYKGRTAVHEITYMSDRLRSAINSGESADKLRQIAENDGTVKLWESCKKLVFKGVTDIRELMGLYTD